MPRIRNMDFLNNRYISKVVMTGMPDKTAWTVNGFKLAYLIACEMSAHRLFITKTSGITSLNDQEVIEHLKKVPKEYEISRDTFQKITGVTKSNTAREISKSCDDLLTKIITLPDPFEPENPKSFEKIQWFSKAKYRDSTGDINVTVHDDMLPYLVVLVNYTKLDYRFIANMKNLYSIRIYLICKIAQNKFNSNLEIETSIEDIKRRIGLQKKYDNIPRFKDRVLDVVSAEINDKTDLNFSYELKKSGKKFTSIVLRFSQKSDIIGEAIKEPKQLNDCSVIDNTLDDYLVDELNRYGIRKEKARQLIDSYGSDNIDSAIECTRSEIKKGKNIANIPGYLITIIENKVKSITTEMIVDEEAEKNSLEESKNREYESNWKAIEDHCLKLETQINRIYNCLMSGEHLLSQQDIDAQSELKIIIDINPDLLHSPRPINGLYVDGNKGVNMSTINALVCDVKVATPQDRIPHIKKAIQEKRDMVSRIPDGLEKDCLNAEINDFMDLLYNLV